MKVTSINPRTGERLWDFQSSTPRQIAEALARARTAQQGWWRDQGMEGRAEAMRELERALLRAKEELVEVAFQELGVPKRSIAASYDSALRGFQHYMERGEAFRPRPFPLDQALWPSTKAVISYEPLGVIGHIGVWNFPLWQTLITVIPGLLAGNAILFKPSELTTATGLRLAEVVRSSGIPPDLFVPVIGGPQVGRRLVGLPLDALVFTGSIGAGMSVARRAGTRPVILELSGNDAGIVCQDADLEQSSRGVATGTFSRAGQVCIRIKRVYLSQDIADAFLERLVGIASRLDPMEQVGPLIREEARERVHRAVRAAVARGARLLAGGEKVAGPGFFYRPTVLLLQDDRLEVMAQETFGPVCSVRVVKDDDEAVSLANRSPYGLGATVWTRDMGRAERLASRLEAGNVWVNEWGRTLSGGEYFQGHKRSGVPSSQERLGLFLRKKTVVMHTASEPRPAWFA